MYAACWNSRGSSWQRSGFKPTSVPPPAALLCLLCLFESFLPFSPGMKTAVCAAASNGLLLHTPRPVIIRPIIGASLPPCLDKHLTPYVGQWPSRWTQDVTAHLHYFLLLLWQSSLIPCTKWISQYSVRWLNMVSWVDRQQKTGLRATACMCGNGWKRNRLLVLFIFRVSICRGVLISCLTITIQGLR